MFIKQNFYSFFSKCKLSHHLPIGWFGSTFKTEKNITISKLNSFYLLPRYRRPLPFHIFRLDNIMNKYILERLRNEHQKRLESKQKCKHILRQTHIISRIYSFIEPTFLISLMNISREWKSTCDDIQKYKEWFQNELSERLSG